MIRVRLFTFAICIQTSAEKSAFREGTVKLRLNVVLAFGLLHSTLALAQNDVPKNINILERPIENPAHYAKIMSATDRLLLVSGQNTGEGCTPTTPGWSCPQAYLFEKQNNEWVRVKTHSWSEAGGVFPKIIDDNHYYIHRTQNTTSSTRADFHELQMFTYDHATKTTQASAAVTFDQPEATAFDGRHLVTITRWHITFIEYDVASDSWSDPRINPISVIHPSDGEFNRHWVDVQDGIAYFETCESQNCPYGFGIAVVDIATESLIDVIDLLDLPSRAFRPYLIDDRIVIKHLEHRPTHEVPSRVYEKVDGVWSLLSEFDEGLGLWNDSTALAWSDDYMLDLRMGHYFGEDASQVIIYAPDGEKHWIPVGLIPIQNGAFKGHNGYYRYLTSMAAGGDTLFLRHEGDSSVGYRIFEISDLSYYLDNDKDLMPDGWELEWGYSTADYDDFMVLDSDHDNLTDAKEFRYMTNPLNSDTDGDGLPDDVEVDWLFDPSDSSDARLDLDGDGVSNLQEYHDNTNPNNKNSFLKSSLPRVTGGGGGGGTGIIWLLVLTAFISRSLKVRPGLAYSNFCNQ